VFLKLGLFCIIYPLLVARESSLGARDSVFVACDSLLVARPRNDPVIGRSSKSLFIDY